MNLHIILSSTLDRKLQFTIKTLVTPLFINSLQPLSKQCSGTKGQTPFDYNENS